MILQTVATHILFLVFLYLAWLALSLQPWYMAWNPSDIGISGSVRNRRADNFESEVGFFALATHLASAGIVYSFGGNYRRPAFKNCILLLVFLLGAFSLIALLFVRSTFVSCLFRINCDSATSRDMDDRVLRLISNTVVRGCFLGPQMLRWGDNSDKVEPERRLSVVALVKEARRSPRTCLPQPSTMDEQLVPEEFRDAAAINNTMSYEFSVLLLVMMACYTVVMVLLHQYLSWSPHVEAMERRTNEGRVNTEMPWLSPPRFSMAAHRSSRSSCGSVSMSEAFSLELGQRMVG
mmetsp:Transcript_112975/g.195257  ORF Transcript_112975/g.195257 Transcript_112975/m.195257 type:complete len:293 (+) Transcript_112975:3-881(+)